MQLFMLLPSSLFYNIQWQCCHCRVQIFLLHITIVLTEKFFFFISNDIRMISYVCVRSHFLHLPCHYNLICMYFFSVLKRKKRMWYEKKTENKQTSSHIVKIMCENVWTKENEFSWKTECKHKNLEIIIRRY